MKSFALSKTFVFNLITLLAALFALPQVTTLIDPQTVIVLQSAVNIVLRVFFTTQAVSLSMPKAGGQ